MGTKTVNVVVQFEIDEDAPEHALIQFMDGTMDNAPYHLFEEFTGHELEEPRGVWIEEVLHD